MTAKITAVEAAGIARLVVCAALRKNGHIICGARHFDDLMRSVIRRIPGESHTGWEQGFVDNQGRFLTRAEALEVARAAAQIRRRCGGDRSQLFSENLY